MCVAEHISSCACERGKMGFLTGTQSTYEPVKDTGWSANSRTPNMAVPRIDKSLIDQRVENHLSKLTRYKHSASCQIMSAFILHVIGTDKTTSVIVVVYRSV